jgi:hypothetical protein
LVHRDSGNNGAKGAPETTGSYGDKLGDIQI